MTDREWMREAREMLKEANEFLISLGWAESGNKIEHLLATYPEGESDTVRDESELYEDAIRLVKQFCDDTNCRDCTLFRHGNRCGYDSLIARAAELDKEGR